MAIVGRKPRWDALPKWRSMRKVSPGQIRISILQLCILFTVPIDLACWCCPLRSVSPVRRALAPILISRPVPECFLQPLNFDALDALINAGAKSRD